MRRIVTLLAAFAIVSTAAAGPNDLSMIVTGERDAVLTLARKAMDAEFSDGSRSDWIGRIGYWTQFKSFFTGATGIGIGLRPVATGDRMEVAGYRLEFGYRVQRGDPSRHITALMDQIAKQAKGQGDVAVVANPDAYVPLQRQYDRCLRQLQADPELAPIASKVALGRAEEATLMILADDSKASESERPIIAKWFGKRDSCFNLYKAEMSFSPADPRVPIVLESVSSANALVVSLFKTELTYGEFAQRRQSINVATTKQLSALTGELNKNQADAQAKAEENSRQQNLDAQRLFIEQQKANAMQTQANKIQTPVMQAPSIPAATNCTTTAVGNSLHTTCN